MMIMTHTRAAGAFAPARAFTGAVSFGAVVTPLG